MKRAIILATLLSSSLSFAQALDQLTQAEVPVVNALQTMEIHYGGTSRPLTVGSDGTQIAAKIQSEFGVTSFSFTAKNNNGSARLWLFDMPERARQAMTVHIQDDFGNPTVGDSARLLETSLYFFPRKVLPAITSDNGVMTAILPTGEEVQFDANSKSIIGGVLKETAPLDMTFDRSKRKFAQLSYSGEGIMIRADRRSGTPESVFNTPYNINEDIKNATVTFKGKTCKVPKALIWEQDENRANYFLYPTDEEFYDKVLKVKCGWTDLPL